MSSGGAKLGVPNLWREASQKIAFKGEEEGVVTAAIDLSKFFDMIVWEVVFSVLGKMGVPDRVWKLQAVW